ncbi:hypothetical protein, partial [Thalassoglobus neptunius]|uniref:hypothetical protein n=1 Tax=Thalassoglobus neptunius TaxID=1938619 RepID=UPI001E49C375
MLVWRMLYLEENAPDSDMDIIFALAMLIWSLILIAWHTGKRMVNYGVLALVSRSCFLLSAMFQRCWGCVASQWLGSNDST